jgi:hypothetical protein
MVVPKTEDDFRAAITDLRSLNLSKGENFHTFSLFADMCVRLLIKNFGRRMPLTVVREDLEALSICVEGVLQLCSGLRVQFFPATPHFIVTMVRALDVRRVRRITQLCGLRITVQSFRAPRGPLQCRRSQRFGHAQRGCSYAPRRVACG